MSGLVARIDPFNQMSVNSLVVQIECVQVTVGTGMVYNQIQSFGGVYKIRWEKLRAGFARLPEGCLRATCDSPTGTLGRQLFSFLCQVGFTLRKCALLSRIWTKQCISKQNKCKTNKHNGKSQKKIHS